MSGLICASAVSFSSLRMFQTMVNGDDNEFTFEKEI